MSPRPWRLDSGQPKPRILAGPDRLTHGCSFVHLLVHTSFRPVLFRPFVPSFPFCTWRSLRWGMSGLTPSDPFG
eukprot:110202-Chlamydomonas_euryale.AAC.1